MITIRDKFCHGSVLILDRSLVSSGVHDIEKWEVHPPATRRREAHTIRRGWQSRIG